MDFEMITLIGIAHVINIRNGLQRIIHNSTPNVIGIELDRTRYQGLVENEKPGNIPLMYKLLSNFQKRAAREFGSTVGDEMLAAVESAGKMNIPVAFIDVPTVAGGKGTDILAQLTLKEKAGLFMGAIAGIFFKKKKIEEELKKFQKEPEKYLSALGKHFPQIKKTLIDDRNRYMVRKILRLSQTYPHVLAVVGDGHVNGICAMLPQGRLNVIRLEQLRQMVNERGDINEKMARKFGYPNLDRNEGTNCSIYYDLKY